MAWQRSLILSVPVPVSIVNGRYITERIKCVAEHWNMWKHRSNLQGRTWSLEHLAKVFDCSRPREYEVRGSTFAEYYDSGDKDKVAMAKSYLIDDLMETKAIAEKLSVLTTK
jgi:hypothetical protein